MRFVRVRSALGTYLLSEDLLSVVRDLLLSGITAPDRRSDEEFLLTELFERDCSAEGALLVELERCSTDGDLREFAERGCLTEGVLLT